jgi:Xaa-Pro aminopeptidase
MKLFSAQTYSARRAQLKSSVKSGLILLLGNDEASINCTDNHYRYRQDSSFLYFFGISQPNLNAIIDVDSGEEVLFGNELSIEDIIIVGQQETLGSMAERVGIKNLQPSSNLTAKISKSLASKQNIHYLPPYRFDNILKLSEWLQKTPSTIKSGASKELINAVVNLRSYKSEEEIIEMTYAVNVSGMMHQNAMKAAMDPQKDFEFELVAEIYRTAKANNCYLAYPAIFSINGQTLHNHYHGNKIDKDRMILNDSGAENEMCYAGDITRTFPANGKFSTKQKEIYGIVLEMEESSIASLKAGVMNRDIHIASNELMLSRLKELDIISGDVKDLTQQGLGGLFMPHGLGHMIGLDVHDMEDLGEDLVGYRENLKRSTQLGLKSLRLAKELEAGFVITVEPGIYFTPELIQKWKAEGKFKDAVNYQKLESYFDFGGIRIEDDILITDTGYRVLGDRIPTTVDEIEEVMSV